VPFRIARRAGLKSVFRSSKCAGLAALVLFFGCENLQNAVANGDTRTISFHHLHTGEDLTITYKVNGRYDEAALKKINWELRDWRHEEPTRMDPHLIDLVWEVQRATGSKGAVQVVCGYRSPATNAMLRARTRGVAQFSQHMLGKAMDFFLPDVPLEKIREVGLQLQRGGVGFYPTSGSPFVHLDTGNVRHWPKVSRQYLAKLFPDGKTVHVPADGRPMPGYQQALAEIKARGSDDVSPIALASAGETAPMADGNTVKKFFAKLFGKKDESGDDEESQITTVAARPVRQDAEPVRTASLDTRAAPAAAASAPMPRPRPAAEIASIAQRQPVQVASLGDAPFPKEITGKSQGDNLALGYAADSIFAPRALSAVAPHVAAEPAPATAAPRRASVPVHEETTASIPESGANDGELYADASHPSSAILFDNRMTQSSGEMHQQNPSIAMKLAAPARVALRSQFSFAPEQPALSRFAGPAVVTLPTVFFGQSAMIGGRTRAD